MMVTQGLALPITLPLMTIMLLMTSLALMTTLVSAHIVFITHVLLQTGWVMERPLATTIPLPAKHFTRSSGQPSVIQVVGKTPSTWQRKLHKEEQTLWSFIRGKLYHSVSSTCADKNIQITKTRHIWDTNGHNVVVVVVVVAYHFSFLTVSKLLSIQTFFHSQHAVY